MKLPMLSALCALAALLLPSCVIVVDDTGTEFRMPWSHDWEGSGGGERLRGSGVAATQVREVGEFRGIELLGATDLRLQVGGERSVRVTCDDNLIERLETRVENGVLKIGFGPGRYQVRTDALVEIGVPSLDSLSLQGSGDASLSGVHGERFTLAVSGSGDVRAQGEVEELHASVSGSGDLSLYELCARRVHASISGSGDIEVCALEGLYANLSGSGDIRCRGNVPIESQTSGSGSVRRD